MRPKAQPDDGCGREHAGGDPVESSSVRVSSSVCVRQYCFERDLPYCLPGLAEKIQVAHEFPFVMHSCYCLGFEFRVAHFSATAPSFTETELRELFDLTRGWQRLASRVLYDQAALSSLRTPWPLPPIFCFSRNRAPSQHALFGRRSCTPRVCSFSGLTQGWCHGGHPRRDPRPQHRCGASGWPPQKSHRQWPTALRRGGAQLTVDNTLFSCMDSAGQ